jgi:type II secretory pathway component PulF
MTNFGGNAASKSTSILQRLQSIQIGGKQTASKMKKRDLIYVLRNVCILIENGLSLPKAFETLVKEKALQKYSTMLQSIKTQVENGDSFSEALSKFPETFTDIMISQIRIGEKSGTIPQTLSRLMHQLEHADNLKSQIIKKMTYPCLLVTAGSGALTFMLLYVVPTFENVYKDSGAKLPAVTQFLIFVGQVGTAYGWILLLAIIASVFSLVYIRKTPTGRMWMDTWMLKIPLLGQFFKNIAVLQFVEVLGNLMDAGFTVVEALRACSHAVGNRKIRSTITEMQEALTRGERFSDELARHGDLFPPVVNQLVIVGEKTGTLSKTTVHIRAHLRREVETYTNVMLGTIEPVMTAGLAAAIGTILLAIYLPMFDMINAMNGSGGH